MGFGQAIQSYLQNYVTFDGRAPRVQVWWVLLFNIVVLVVASIIDNVLGTNFQIPGPEGMPIMMPYGWFYLIGALALLLPSLSLAFRRLHDRDKSAWWLLLSFIPLIGGIILFVWMYCLRGTVGDNRFGPDPLGGKAA